MKRHLWIVFVGLGFWMLAVGGAMVLFVATQGWPPFRQNFPPLGPRQPDEIDPDDGRLADAFRVGDEAPDDADVAEIRDLLDRLNDGMKQKDSRRIGACFDGDRMYHEVTRLTALPRRSAAYDQGLRQGLVRGIEESMVAAADTVAWNRLEMKRVRLLKNGIDAAVYSRRDTPLGTRVKTRWWVSKRSGRWLIYDMEELAIGSRLSDTLAMLLASAGGGPLPPWVRQGSRMREVVQAMRQGQLDQADQVLQELTQAPLPRRMLALCWLLRGSVAVQRGDATAALEHLDMAESLHADLPALDLLRALAHNQLGAPERAVEHARRYLERLGDDSDAYLQLGIALAALKRQDEAADAFRKGLDDLPESLDLVVQLRRVLPAGKKGELAARYQALPKLEDIVSVLADDALMANDAEALELIVADLTRREPEHAGVSYYTCRRKVLQSRPAEAVAHFKKALERTPEPEKRSYYTSGYLRAMAWAGHALTAYESAPDRDEAFRLLGNAVMWQSPSTLECLIEAHRRKHPDDIWLLYYTGWLHDADGQLDLAETALAEGMARAADDQTRSQFRWLRVQSLFKAGRGLWAYENVGPRDETFDQLAARWEGDDDIDSLESLVRLHRKHAPDESRAIVWEAVVWSRRERHEEVVRLLAEHKKAIQEDQDVGWRWSPLMYRSLLRLNRYDEALAEAGEDLLLQAVVQAVRGDVAGTEAALARCAEAGFSAWDFYFDEDLGPVLRTERFANLRDKYPEPPPPPVQESDDP